MPAHPQAAGHQQPSPARAELRVERWLRAVLVALPVAQWRLAAQADPLEGEWKPEWVVPEWAVPEWVLPPGVAAAEPLHLPRPWNRPGRIPSCPLIRQNLRKSS